jgi:hypothetical protein
MSQTLKNLQNLIKELCYKLIRDNPYPKESNPFFYIDFPKEQLLKKECNLNTITITLYGCKIEINRVDDNPVYLECIVTFPDNLIPIVEGLIKDPHSYSYLPTISTYLANLKFPETVYHEKNIVHWDLKDQTIRKKTFVGPGKLMEEARGLIKTVNKIKEMSEI